MEESRALRRRRPEPEPGPRLLPVLLAIVVAGFVIGAASKVLYGKFHQHGRAPDVWPTTTPSPTATPNYSLVHASATKLPPIPTPKGTWYVDGTIRPFKVVIAPSSSPVPSSHPSPSPKPSATPKSHSKQKPTPKPKATPTEAASPMLTPTPHVTHSPKPTERPTLEPTPTPSPEPTLKPVVKHAHATPHPLHTVHPSAKYHFAPVSLPTVEPASDVSTWHADVQSMKPSHAILRTPTPTIEETPAPESAPVHTLTQPEATPKPRLSGPARIVRSYLSALIRGDEKTAYRLLGAAPGDKHAGLDEESFINTSAQITSIKSAGASTAGSVVHAEIETAGGIYFGTYHVENKDGTYVITGHSFIKL
jgi:hypothetical protein